MIGASVVKEPWFDLVAGAVVGAMSMLLFRYTPKRFHYAGFFAAALIGGLLAQLALTQVSGRGHSFEYEPEYYLVPSVIAMIGVFAATMVVAKKRKSIWLGAATGAAVYQILRVIVLLAMI